MWKWVALAALIYGLLGMWAILKPRPHSLPDLFTTQSGEDQLPGPAGISLPLVLDFEHELPPPVTRPESQAAVIEMPDGNHLLEWRYDAGAGPMHSLGLPIRADGSPQALLLDIKADYGGVIVVGIRERDGSIYAAQQHLTKDTEDHLKIPLGSLRLSERTTDENGKLDLQDIAVIIVDPHIGRKTRWRGKTTIQLDNIRLK